MAQAMPARPAVLTTWPDDEEKLFLAILGLYREGGFAVHRSCHRQQKRLAEKFREEIDREGWII